MAKPDVTVLQLCPNDSPPFREICLSYKDSLTSLGYSCITAFFEKPHGEALPGAIYLNSESKSNRNLGNLLLQRLSPRQIASCKIGLCHRYRSLQVIKKLGLKLEKTVCIAHEFSMFRTLKRRINYLSFDKGVIFGGVSKPLVNDLERYIANPVLLPNALNSGNLTDSRISSDLARTFFDLKDDQFNVGVVGRLHQKKQPDLALEGFLEFVTSFPESTLTFVGDGDLLRPLKQITRDPRVRFYGFVANITRYISAFDVLLITSSKIEAFNMVALEAMAAGIRVIAGPAEGPAFVMGKTAIYFQEFSAPSISEALTFAYQEEKDARLAAIRMGEMRAKSHFSTEALADRLALILGPIERNNGF